MELDRTLIKGTGTAYPKLWEPGVPRGLYRVSYSESVVLRRAVLQFATYFRREFQYDFIQYSLDRNIDDTDEKVSAYLFGEPMYCGKLSSYGACCFRYRDKYTDLQPHWALQWIWLHPYKRNDGILTELWPYFESKFRNFMVESPLSRAMEYFLKNKPMQYPHDYKAIAIE